VPIRTVSGLACAQAWCWVPLQLCQHWLDIMGEQLQWSAS
jgi:hypothetical protein